MTEKEGSVRQGMFGENKTGATSLLLTSAESDIVVVLWNTWSSFSLHSNNTAFMKCKHWQFTRPDWSHKPDFQDPRFTVQGTYEHHSLMTPSMNSYLTKERGESRGTEMKICSNPAVHAFWMRRAANAWNQKTYSTVVALNWQCWEQ